MSTNSSWDLQWDFLVAIMARDRIVLRQIGSEAAGNPNPWLAALDLMESHMGAAKRRSLDV
jgi:hypothetical protein